MAGWILCGGTGSLLDGAFNLTEHCRRGCVRRRAHRQPRFPGIKQGYILKSRRAGFLRDRHIQTMQNDAKGAVHTQRMEQSLRFVRVHTGRARVLEVVAVIGDAVHRRFHDSGVNLQAAVCFFFQAPCLPQRGKRHAHILWLQCP